ncbi:major capsid protein [Paenibacillus tianjinensis]|uniref:Major capsid protein n=1 Tax=Paenibacillus tianjinensis TaxID=2810347 RepID=A0ABX7L484_9BACL|nr:major capsid protein [Paenibacillus tianjinensis]QSF42665.1 major capsid protein [Paenibacillus tianjinensis]
MDEELLLLEEALSGEELLTYASNITVPNDYWQNVLFPPQQTDELTVEVIKASSRLPVMAQIAELGTETRYGSREGVSGMQVEIPKIQRGRWMDEKLIRLLLQANQGGGLRRQEISRIVREQLNDGKYAVDAIRARREWIAMQAVSVGAISYAEGDVKISVDYGFVNDQKPVLSGTDRWSDTENSRPLEDIQTWFNYQKDRGVSLTRAFTTQAIVSLLLQNKSARIAYHGDPSGSANPPQLTQAQLNSVTDSLQLPRIVAYDTQARTENDALTDGKVAFSNVRMAPQNRFVMLPDGPLGNYLWAETTESMVDGIEAELTGDMGIYVFRDLVSRHPLRLRTVGVNLAFPVFPYADSVMSATVI